MDPKQKNEEFTEFETKYRVDGSLIYDFKQFVKEKLPDYKESIYIESDDIYYVKGDEFLRYRFSDDKKIKRAELTYKQKTVDNHNIVRKEVNLRVDQNDKDTVAAMAEALGFEKNFKISKIVHIYVYEDATLPFYTVYDEDGKVDHFMEIEVDEALIPKITKEEAMDIIKKYESLLSPLGITAQKRLKKSLFEMYRK